MVKIKDGLSITDGFPSHPDYRDLVSDEDWEKYFNGKQMFYNDPLKLAMIRTMEKMILVLEKKEK